MREGTGGQVGHLSKKQFAALLDGRYCIDIMKLNNLKISHVDEVHTLEHLEASHLFTCFLLCGISVVRQYEVHLDSLGCCGILLFSRLP